MIPESPPLWECSTHGVGGHDSWNDSPPLRESPSLSPDTDCFERSGTRSTGRRGLSLVPRGERERPECERCVKCEKGVKRETPPL
jgi:hypothetical protein